MQLIIVLDKLWGNYHDIRSCKQLGDGLIEYLFHTFILVLSSEQLKTSSLHPMPNPCARLSLSCSPTHTPTTLLQQTTSQTTPSKLLPAMPTQPPDQIQSESKLRTGEKKVESRVIESVLSRKVTKVREEKEAKET
jgi:hypothetical protein